MSDAHEQQSCILKSRTHVTKELTWIQETSSTFFFFLSFRGKQIEDQQQNQIVSASLPPTGPTITNLCLRTVTRFSTDYTRWHLRLLSPLVIEKAFRRGVLQATRRLLQYNQTLHLKCSVPQVWLPKYLLKYASSLRFYQQQKSDREGAVRENENSQDHHQSLPILKRLPSLFRNGVHWGVGVID